MKQLVRYITISLLLFLTSVPFALGQDKLRVVVTFSVLGDFVKNIAGNEVQLDTLVGPDGDAHVYQPTPFAANQVAEANLLVINGLEFEGWLERLQESSGFSGKLVVASSGIDLIRMEEEGHHDEHEEEGHHDEHAKDEHHDEHAKDEHAKDEHHDEHAKDEHAKDEHHDEHEKEGHHDEHHHGEYDPHGWHSLPNAKIYVENIRKALVEAAPSKASVFNKNAEAYLAQLNALEKTLKAEVKQIPENRRKVITSHDAFGYLGKDMGMEFMAPQGLSTESEPSAGDVARIIRQINKDNIKAVFIENVSDSRLIEQIARETGVAIGGKLYSDALSGSDEPASTYLKKMEHNIRTIVDALK